MCGVVRLDIEADQSVGNGDVKSDWSDDELDGKRSWRASSLLICDGFLSEEAIELARGQLKVCAMVK